LPIFNPRKINNTRIVRVVVTLTAKNSVFERSPCKLELLFLPLLNLQLSGQTTNSATSPAEKIHFPDSDSLGITWSKLPLILGLNKWDLRVLSEKPDSFPELQNSISPGVDPTLSLIFKGLDFAGDF
jgi:hypothetical protein